MFKYLNRIKSNFEYKFRFLKVIFSPLKPLTTIWYFGEIKHGTPYFLPRKWVKLSKEDCEKSLQKDLELANKFNKPFNRTWEYYKNYKKPIPIKYFGFNFVSLGWKTKYDEYRFEWNPCISLVIFGKQLFVAIVPKIGNRYYDSYWEAWLNYEYRTNKKLSRKERVLQLFEKYSCTWIGSDGKLDHYEFILKEKYLKLYSEWKKNS